jgi:hypothetical protein
MAILTGKGYATEAIRGLLTASGCARDYEVFVFQNADHADLNIALTVREESTRMLGYSVDVIDIGLSYADAEACDNDGEPYPRRVDCQTWTDA